MNVGESEFACSDLKDYLILERLLSLKYFFRENPTTKEHYTDELKISFKDFITKSNEGYFEYIKDVSCCKWNYLCSEGLSYGYGCVDLIPVRITIKK